MTRLPGYELEGIKAIASYMGLSEASVKRIIARPEGTNRFTVMHYLSRVFASKADIDAWREREKRER